MEKLTFHKKIEMGQIKCPISSSNLPLIFSNFDNNNCSHIGLARTCVVLHSYTYTENSKMSA